MSGFKRKQTGMSFISLIFVGGVLVFGGIVLAQVFPTLVEYQAIDKAVNKAKSGNTVAEIRNIFDKARDIDDIKSVTAKDLEITKIGDKTVVSFAYSKEIHLGGPAYLLLKYSGSSK